MLSIEISDKFWVFNCFHIACIILNSSFVYLFVQMCYFVWPVRFFQALEFLALAALVQNACAAYLSVLHIVTETCFLSLHALSVALSFC